jgi:hypothetical protein
LLIVRFNFTIAIEMPIVELSDANVACTVRRLGEVLGLSTRQIHHLEREGVLKRISSKVSNRRYRLADNVQSYLRYQRDYVTRKYSINGDQAYNTARCRRMSALAAIEEVRAKQITGELLRRDRVVFVMTNLLSQVKNHMLGILRRTTQIRGSTGAMQDGVRLTLLHVL